MLPKEFLYWEKMSRDTIDFKKVYVDIARGDLVSGLLLSQIVYWYLPDHNGHTKLRVKKKNDQGEMEYWLAKGRDDWYDEIRITAKQFDRAIKILTDENLVEKKRFKFDGSPTVHIRLKLEEITERVNSFFTKGEKPVVTGDSEVENNGKTAESLAPLPFLPKGKMEFDERVKTITESTTKNTKDSINTSYLWEEPENQSSNEEDRADLPDGRPTPYVDQNQNPSPIKTKEDQDHNNKAEKFLALLEKNKEPSVTIFPIDRTNALDSLRSKQQVGEHLTLLLDITVNNKKAWKHKIQSASIKKVLATFFFKYQILLDETEINEIISFWKENTISPKQICKTIENCKNGGIMCQKWTDLKSYFIEYAIEDTKQHKGQVKKEQNMQKFNQKNKKYGTTTQNNFKNVRRFDDF